MRSHFDLRLVAAFLRLAPRLQRELDPQRAGQDAAVSPRPATA